jgi:hypothetical protein
VRGALGIGDGAVVARRLERRRLVDPGGAAVGIDRGEAFLDQHPDPGGGRGAGERLAAQLADAVVFRPGAGTQRGEARIGDMGGQVDRRVAPGHRAAQRDLAEQFDPHRLAAEPGDRLRICRRARHRRHLMAAREQNRNEPPPDDPGRAGEENLHATEPPPIGSPYLKPKRGTRGKVPAGLTPVAAAGRMAA